MQAIAALQHFFYLLIKNIRKRGCKENEYSNYEI